MLSARPPVGLGAKVRARSFEALRFTAVRSGRAVPRDRHADKPERGRIDSADAVAALGRSCREHRARQQTRSSDRTARGHSPLACAAVLRYRRSANGRVPHGTCSADFGELAISRRDGPVEAYRHLVYGEIEEARRLAVSELTAPKKIWGGDAGDFILLRLAVDAMLESGEAQRAVDFLETLAPEYAQYKARKDIDPQDFTPAPVPVKSAWSSYPALYFTDYSRALRATGDDAGANQMLDHLEAILELRRKRGLFIEERYAAKRWRYAERRRQHWTHSKKPRLIGRFTIVGNSPCCTTKSLPAFAITLALWRWSGRSNAT